MKKVTVKNKTKDTTFEMDYADTWFRKSFGLMFRTGGRLVFPIDDERSVHSWFVFTKLYVYVVDRGEVLEATELPPFSVKELGVPPDYLIESSKDLGFEIMDEVTVEVDEE